MSWPNTGLHKVSKHIKGTGPPHNVGYITGLMREMLILLFASPQKNLAKKLSEKEVHRARENFRAFDTDGDGVITEFEARRAFRSWYSLFVPDPSEMSLRDR